MDRPLSDVVVLDLTRALAGPIAGRLLADLGAEVIKIEPPDGDLTRAIVPRVDGMSAYYVQYNAGKRCVSLDLSRPEGRDVLLRMVEKADIVLENYRPDVMGRLGLGYDVLAAHNPRIILASVSGWGHGNARSNQGAYASAIHAEAGITEMVARRRGESDHPRNDPMSHSDTYGGLHALAAVLAALHMRDRTGRGQAVEVSMAESTLVVNDMAANELTGQDPMTGFKGGQNWSAIYPLRSGRHVNVTIDATTRGGFGMWCKATGRPELADDPRFATEEDRVANRGALEAEIGRWVAGFDTAAELEAAIGVSTVLAAEVRTVPELAATDWAAERGAFVPIDVGRGNEVTVPQAPWRFSDADSGVKPFAGFRGEHNREVLADLAGVDDTELARLVADGVISDRVPEWRGSGRDR
ncbi:MAG: CoA transferase [Acidimicrobiales bacterium]|jgi:CoA:oxalate CoA-transferase|nr:CoA transferase [Acidimicrobiales bacterium]